MKPICELLSEMPTTFRAFEKRPGIYQLIAPIFHEDGDMMNIYLEKTGENGIKICDHGASLMRLSYTFDVDSDKKKKVLNDIIANREATMEDGNIEIIANESNLFSRIMTFSQLVSEICNMDILTREMVTNLFYEYLSESIDELQVSDKISVYKDYQVKGHDEFKVDYAFLGNGDMRPIYLFGVRGTDKAQQTAINCLNMTLEKVPHKSVSVFENIETVTPFARNSLINACGKVFSDLNNFKKLGAAYINEELKAS